MHTWKKAVTVSFMLALVFNSFLYGCSEKREPAASTPAATAGYFQISQEEALDRMKKDHNFIIVDARSEEEFDEAHIPGAVNIPKETIKTKQPEQLPDLEQTIFVYCRNGSCSKEAAQKLAQIGYTHVYDFGGINDWKGDLITQEDTLGMQELDSDIAPFFGSWASESGNLTLRIFKGDGFILMWEDADNEAIYGHLEFTDQDRGMWASGPRYELIDNTGEVVYGNAFLTKAADDFGEITFAFGGGAEKLKETCPISARSVFEDNVMNQYSGFVADEGEYAEVVMLVSNRDLKDFKFVRLTLKNLSEDGKADFASEPLYAQDVLSFNKPFFVKMTFSENIPTYGFSYTDNEGVTHLYTLNISGMDGSILTYEIQ